MAAKDTFGWLEIGRIAEELCERHPSADPLTLRFTELRRMIEALPGFAGDPAHPVNERILEEVQARWVDERDDRPRDDEEE